ncbi:MAG: hypothetical protein K6T59_13505, partial [Bryobacteraceae bacterium]|nr:hypothetical protein [Bryobacteraceae bacterium]
MDRVPKSQLRSIRLLHESFVRNLASSLSAYLRAYLTINLVSVEQLSYSEFQEGLSSPTALERTATGGFSSPAASEISRYRRRISPSSS